MIGVPMQNCYSSALAVYIDDIIAYIKTGIDAGEHN